MLEEDRELAIIIQKIKERFLWSDCRIESWFPNYVRVVQNTVWFIVKILEIEECYPRIDTFECMTNKELHYLDYFYIGRNQNLETRWRFEKSPDDILVYLIRIRKKITNTVILSSLYLLREMIFLLTKLFWLLLILYFTNSAAVRFIQNHMN